MKQSSIEWLIQEIQNLLDNSHQFHPEHEYEIINQAKEMHKQESENDYIAGGNYARCCSTLPKDIKESHGQYYNETYNIKR